MNGLTCCCRSSCAAINGNRQLRAAKDAADVSYGQLHVAAAMLHVGAVPPQVQPPQGEDEEFMNLSQGESLPVLQWQDCGLSCDRGRLG